jgi:hypothetical protein
VGRTVSHATTNGYRIAPIGRPRQFHGVWTRAHTNAAITMSDWPGAAAPNAYRSAAAGVIGASRLTPSWPNGQRLGKSPNWNRRHHRVAGPVDHRNSVGAAIRDVDLCPIRGDGDSVGAIPHRDR